MYVGLAVEALSVAIAARCPGGRVVVGTPMFVERLPCASVKPSVFRGAPPPTTTSTGTFARPLLAARHRR